MKKTTLLGLFLSLIAVAQIATAAESNLPFDGMPQNDRPCYTNVQGLADDLIAKMPTSKWVDHADVSWYADDNNEFTLSTAAQLAGLSKLVSEGKNMADKTIKLAADIDLGAHRFTPIGINNQAAFSGTFDGDNHKIISLKVAEPTLDFAGFIGQTNKAYIKNLQIKHATVVGMSNVGTIAGNIYNHGKVENCHAADAVVVSAPFESQDAGQSAGGLLGSMLDFSEVNACSVNNLEVNCVMQGGGLTSQAYNKCKISNSYVSNVRITGDKGVCGGFLACNLAFMPNTETIVENSYVIKGHILLRDASEYSTMGGFIANVMANLTIRNCYSSTELVGGLIQGAFVARSTTAPGAAIVYDKCYYNEDIVGGVPALGSGETVEGIFGRKEAVMQSAEFVNELNAGVDPAPWARDENVNEGFPYLIKNAPGTTSISSIFGEGNTLRAWFANGMLHLQASQLGTIEIYALDGRLVYQRQIESLEQSFPLELASGTYALRLGNSTCKLVQH